MRSGGAAPVLAIAVAGFFAAFALLRGSSTFLAVEAEAPVLRPLAQQHRVDLATVLALREQAPALAMDRFAAHVADFSRLRAELGDELAAVALAGERDLVRNALGRHEGDRAAAWRALHLDPRALPGLRLQQMRARFANRAAAREAAGAGSGGSGGDAAVPVDPARGGNARSPR